MHVEPGRAETRGPARETRLLLLTLVISAVVLALLAQFRFPDGAQRSSAPPATALAELATRAAFDAQAGALRDVARRLEGSLVHLRWRPPTGARSDTALSLAGLRIRDDLALVGFPPAVDVTQGSIEAAADSGWLPAPRVGTDYTRGLVVLRVPGRPAPVLSIAPDSARVPGFLAAAHGGPAGPGLRPVWIGTLAPVEKSAWNAPVWAQPEGADGSAAGTLLFTIDGSLVAVATDDPAGAVLVPAGLALGRANELARGRSFTGGDAGFAVVDLASPALRAAAGRSDGALVGWIDPAGPSGARLQTGDVVIAVDGDTIREAAEFARAMARREPASRTTITMVRGGQEQSISLVLRTPTRFADIAAATPSQSGTPAASALGLTLQQSGDSVLVAGVDAAGTAADVLSVGDRITWLQGQPRPTPAAIARTYDALPRGGAFLLRIVLAPAVAPLDARAAPEQTVAILKP